MQPRRHTSADGILQQLPGGQPQLHHRRRASDECPPQRGIPSCRGDDPSLYPWQGKSPQSIAADASYGNGELLQWLMDREITPYMPTRDAVARTRSPFFGPERFTYQPESNSYICPAGQQLNYGGRNDRNRAFAYIGTRNKCGPCPLKPKCTRGAFRFLAIHMNEAARQRARDLWNTPEFEHAQRQRKKVEALFAELKNRIGLHRLRLRRLKFVQEQFFLGRPLPRTSNDWSDS